MIYKSDAVVQERNLSSPSRSCQKRLVVRQTVADENIPHSLWMEILTEVSPDIDGKARSHVPVVETPSGGSICGEMEVHWLDWHAISEPTRGPHSFELPPDFQALGR